MTKKQAMTAIDGDRDAKVETALAALLEEIEKTPVSERLTTLVHALDAAIQKAAETRRPE